MVLIALPLLYLVLLALLYRTLAARNANQLWPTALFWGSGLGAGRGLLAAAAWYVVEHEGGPLQIPAYAVAMFAWPEAAVLGPARGTAAPGHYTRLVLLLFGSTVLAVVVVALLVQTRRRVKPAQRHG
jgi:hypothetical protein